MLREDRWDVIFVGTAHSRVECQPQAGLLLHCLHMHCLPHVCPVEVQVSSPAASPQLGGEFFAKLLTMTTPTENMWHDRVSSA